MRPVVETALALIILIAGFVLAESVAGRALGDAVAAALAWAALPLLALFEPEVIRNGAELRGTGWAVRVGVVCDGHGLAISLAAGLAALRGGWRRLFAGLAAIQLFNLFRIIVLAVVLARSPGAFDMVHIGLFPLLTVALLAFCMLPAGQAVRLLLVALPMVALWLPLADSLSLPLAWMANSILSALPAPEIGEIARRATGWSIGSYLLASTENGQVALHVAPLRPADFALATPVVLAAVVLARRPLWLAPAFLSMLLALVAAAFTAVWTLANGHAPVVLLIPDGAGAFVPSAFAPPAGLQLPVRLAQNVLVHFNLLVLPMLVAALAPRPGRA